MKLKTVIPIAAVTGACALAAVPAASAAAGVQEASSQNWSGYVAGGSGSTDLRYRSVTGSWTVPTVKCDGGTAYSSVWDGLGGAGDKTALEQAGTEGDCSADGAAGYFAWYELVPSTPVRIDMAVHPGDRVTSTVTVNGTDVSIHLVNDTTGASFAKALTMSDPDVSSAEWIAEAPSSCDQGASNCTPLSLADFGAVKFTGASATTVDGHTGPISDPAWSATAVALDPGATAMGAAGPQFTAQESSAGAAPSALSGDGSAFSVSWTGGYGGGWSDGYGGYGPGTYILVYQ